jgi:hypothetical protein
VNLGPKMFLMGLKTEIFVVKNQLIIDNITVNFKIGNCYVKMISRDTIVHIFDNKIEFYSLKFNH